MFHVSNKNICLLEDLDRCRIISKICDFILTFKLHCRGPPLSP